MPLSEMANLFMSLHLAVAPGLDNNPNNLVACTTFFSEATRAMLCLIRVETDPQDRTQLRLTVASGDQYLTFELKEFIKEHLVDIPRTQVAPPRAAVQPQLPTTAPATYNDPGTMLAGLL
ncbi:AP-2 complex subunit alpha-2 [Zea mays]|nr:AP-2 complex subunit alpha-2 [Zea mays]